MPTQAAWAPKGKHHRDAASVTVPPDAITGTGGAASTTAGTNGSVATLLQTYHAGLPALRDDHVDTRRDCAPRLLGAADREHDDSHRPRAHARRTRRGPPNKKDTMRSPTLEGFIEMTMMIFGENEVAAERPVRSATPSHGRRLRRLLTT